MNVSDMKTHLQCNNKICVACLVFDILTDVKAATVSQIQ